MALNDFCRLCKVNLRVKGALTSTKKLFDSNGAPDEKSVSERLQGLGITLKKDNSRSMRICRTCLRLIGRLERDLSAFRRWQEEETENSAEAATPSDDQQGATEAPEAARLEKRDREQTPPETPTSTKKLRPASPTPAHTPTGHLTKPADKTPPCGNRVEVIVHYPSRPGGDRTMCPAEAAGLVEHIVTEKWGTACSLIVRHEKLFGQLKENILRVIEDECQMLANPYKGFMLWSSSPDSLWGFSLEKLQSDLQRMSPFVYSLLYQITKQSTDITCVAAAIALRGREPRLSALSYYISSVLQHGGVKKKIFKKLSKLGLTTSHTAALGKRKELAKACGERLQQLEDDREHDDAGVQKTNQESASALPGE